jgi:putative ABC transport system permease protein
MLCLVGGVIGIVLLLATTALGSWLSNKMDWGIEVAIDWSDVALGLALSAVIGLISGLAPAYAAARLDPVEAMRSK